MFNPPNIKYKKIRKGVFKNKESNLNSTKLKFGICGIQFLHKGFITFSQIEAVRRIISKNIKGVGKLWIFNLPNVPRTAKPLEFRMGKGKGNISKWVWKVKAGTILFEVSYIGPNPNWSFMNKALHKLPIKSRVIFKDE